MERFSRQKEEQLEKPLLSSKEVINKRHIGMWWKRDDTSENRKDIAEIKKALLTSIDDASKSFHHIAIAIGTVEGRNRHNFSEYGSNIYKNMKNKKLSNGEAKSILANAYSLDKFIYDSLIFNKNYAGSDITNFNESIQAIKTEVTHLSEMKDLSERDSN